MKKSGYKMKGSPMQRNFGISPLKDENQEKIDAIKKANEERDAKKRAIDAANTAKMKYQAGSKKQQIKKTREIP